MQCAIRRGTLSFFIESTAPRIPRILDTEVNDWLAQRNGEAELVDSPPLPANRPPMSCPPTSIAAI